MGSKSESQIGYKKQYVLVKSKAAEIHENFSSNIYCSLKLQKSVES